MVCSYYLLDRGANLRYTATSLKDPCKRELDERDQELREGAQLKVRLGCTAPARLGDSADTKGEGSNVFGAFDRVKLIALCTMLCQAKLHYPALVGKCWTY